MKKKFFVAILSLTIFGGCIGNNDSLKSDTTLLHSNSGTFLPTTSSGALVTKVSDGDTLHVLLNGKAETLRLIGIDTPETVDPRKPIQCFGREASKKTKELTEHQEVLLESDKTQADRDKYGRLLRYVYLSDGSMLNELLIREGYGFEYTYKVPYLKQKDFKKAENTARESKKGLWADDTCAGIHK